MVAQGQLLALPSGCAGMEGLHDSRPPALLPSPGTGSGKVLTASGIRWNVRNQLGTSDRMGIAGDE